MAETRVAFDDADAYDRYMGRWSRAIGEKFLAWLDAPKNLCWLDVGCGTGAFTELVIARAAPEKIVGIDPSPAQLEHAEDDHRAASGLPHRQRHGSAVPEREFDVRRLRPGDPFLPGPAEGIPRDAPRDQARRYRRRLYLAQEPDDYRRARTVRWRARLIEIAGDVMSSPAVPEAMPEGIRAALTAAGMGISNHHD